MLSTQYQCSNEQRRSAIRSTLKSDGSPIVNGIDYLEVSADPKTLYVQFIHPLLASRLTPDNILIEAEGQSQTIIVDSVSVFATQLTVRVNTTGDRIPYTLRLIKSVGDRTPPDGFDPQLSQVSFRFQLAELSEFDCATTPAPAEKQLDPPAIDYLAKDYASFRQLMLDRLSVTMPHWKERSPADVGIMLVELVAYAADHLSYYQDAVSTEAYLGTARKRVSVRRHARLLNYRMHDGCNARTWVVLIVSDRANGKTILGGTSDRSGVRFLTKNPDLPLVLTPEAFEKAMNNGSQVFEVMHDLTLYSACNTIYFYTWGDEQCSLAIGATRATLEDKKGLLQRVLKPGSVLVFEEVLGPASGRFEEADLTHRHVVRLTSVHPKTDPLFNDISVLEIEWSLEDALPFTLVISTIVNHRVIPNTSIVRGNVVFVDHGYTIEGEVLPPIRSEEKYRPCLQKGVLTQQGYVQNSRGIWVTIDPETSAAAASQWDLQNVQPAITLSEDAPSEFRWQPQRDLLNSDRFAREFVVETEDDGRAYLRFGNGELGREPRPGAHFTATYRIGNGTVGNVGSDVIAHLYAPNQDLAPLFDSVTGGRSPIYNPLPAKGGTDPEPIEQVKLYASQAFRTQQRAVTEADYANITERFPGVRKALATRRWTGSWYTIFITIDRAGGRPVDDAFRQALQQFLERYRLTGHDLEIESPRFVPLEIILQVTVAPDYFRSQVKLALQTTFSSQVLPNGQLGFFHPDNFTFGQSVYLSQVITTAMQVVGVRSVSATRFQRQGSFTRRALEAGQITFDRLEIAQLTNDPVVPSGTIDFVMEGGL